MVRINKIVNTQNLIKINKKFSVTKISENNQKFMESMINKDYYIDLIYNSIQPLYTNNKSFDNVIKILREELLPEYKNESYNTSRKIKLILQSLKFHYKSFRNDDELKKRCIKLLDIIMLDYYDL